MAKVLRSVLMVFGLMIFISNAHAQSSLKPKVETCLLHHCKNGQMQTGELSGANSLEVRSGKGSLLEVISYKIEVIFHDDVMSSQVKGAQIPKDIAGLIAKLESGAIIKIKQVKAKEKSGTIVSAPDLTLKIF